MAGKWNYKTKQYDDYKLPIGSCLNVQNDNDIVACASCGKHIIYANSYSSFEIHNQFGLGYPVCTECHQEEAERYFSAKERGDIG